MTTEPLQKFGYKDSPYHRPNQEWVCGYAASGRACPQGPSARGECCGGHQCVPLDQDGRWICTRSDLDGGRCTAGPNPDGRCGAALPPCQPVRSVRARRRLTTRWTAVVVVGLLLAIMGGRQGMAMLEPGDRINAHAQLPSCDVCHAAADHPMSAWPAFAADGTPDDSARCLNCHQVGDEPRHAHGMDPAALTALAPPAATGGGRPGVRVANALLVNPSQPLECGQCHSEHQGSHADITAISDARCQSCHSQRFSSFAAGHPEFESFPASRRTRIRFDHAEHIAKYFAETDGPRPESCADCHVTAMQQGLMVLRGFEPACGSCHSGDIAGAGRADSPGVAILQVPGFDVATLAEADVATGAWPEFAESRGGPFFAALMHTDADAHQALETLNAADIDWLDLRDAEPAVHQAARTLILAYKRLLLDLRDQGPPLLVDRLAAAGRLPADRDMSALVEGLSTDTIAAAIQAWFPAAEQELQAYEDGELALWEPQPLPESDDADEDEDDFDAGEFDDFFGGGDEDIFGGGDDIFGGGDEIDLDALNVEEDTPGSEEDSQAEPASLDLRMASGGWYLDDMSLRYRPSGHADTLMRSWLDHADDSMIAEVMLDPASPGRCTKCHSVDQSDQGLAVNWFVRRPDPHQHEFTEFNHRAHFSLMGEDGCTGCHSLNSAADYNAGFADADPHSFASNFHNLDKAQCANCHTGERAGDSCSSCHNYHIGEFSTTAPVNKLSMALEDSG